MPVVGIDLVSHNDVAHVLRDLQRPYLVSGVGFLIDGIGRTKEDGMHPQAAGEQLLGEIDFKLVEAAGNVADVRMSESVIADLMPFAINAGSDVAEAVGLQADQEENSGCVLALKNVQNLRGPV